MQGSLAAGNRGNARTGLRQGYRTGTANAFGCASDERAFALQGKGAGIAHATGIFARGGCAKGQGGGLNEGNSRQGNKRILGPNTLPQPLESRTIGIFTQ